MTLEELHRRIDARFATYQGVDAPAGYGSVEDEHRALCEAAGLLDRSWVDGLELAGADRARFLNGYVTCDVAPIEPGGGTYGFITQVKGRIIADVLVLALEDRLWLELPAGKGGEVAGHLGKYAVFDQVELGPLERVPLSLIGPRAAEVLDGVVAPDSPQSHDAVELFGHEARLVRETDLGELPMWTLWVDTKTAAPLWEELLAHDALRPVGFEAWDRLRVEAGRPLCGQDYGLDNFPQETGLDNTVSYTKGCYLGQEVVARIHYRGGVNKLLRGLRFDGPPAAAGTPVVHDGRAAGVVTSTASSPSLGAVGLSILHKRVEPGARVEIEGVGKALVVDLPFEPLQ